MLGRVLKQSIKRSAIVAPRIAKPQTLNCFKMVPVRTYYKNNVLMPREYGDGYMADPIVTAERVVRCIALHDNLTVHASEIQVGSSF